MLRKKGENNRQNLTESAIGMKQENCLEIEMEHKRKNAC